jgi:hypothetical protein
MVKGQKFIPGTFLEMDDPYEGRKVVMVGKDGVTFLDSLQMEYCTPLIIHPAFHPVALGSTLDFVRRYGLVSCLGQLLPRLRGQSTDQERDSLFVMRALWFLACRRPEALPGGEDWTVDETGLAWAIECATKQEARALRFHYRIEQACQHKPG